MNAPSTVLSQTASPAAGQIQEILKNVASMNNKVGGKRKTRRNRKQTRKNKKARKGTRRH